MDMRKKAILQSAIQRLADEDVDFTVHNNGLHVVIGSAQGIVDFWPTTGKWLPRNNIGGGALVGEDDLFRFLRTGESFPTHGPEPVLCDICNGTGEGMWDGSICQTCRGKGEVAP